MIYYQSLILYILNYNISILSIFLTLFGSFGLGDNIGLTCVGSQLNFLNNFFDFFVAIYLFEGRAADDLRRLILNIALFHRNILLKNLLLLFLLFNQYDLAVFVKSIYFFWIWLESTSLGLIVQAGVNIRNCVHTRRIRSHRLLLFGHFLLLFYLFIIVFIWNRVHFCNS